jgi:hypothetical protein
MVVPESTDCETTVNYTAARCAARCASQLAPVLDSGLSAIWERRHFAQIDSAP